jgi:CRISPR-associated endonuclease/helicase Cas3
MGSLSLPCTQGDPFRDHGQWKPPEFLPRLAIADHNCSKRFSLRSRDRGLISLFISSTTYTVAAAMHVESPWAKTAPSGETCSLLDHCRHVAVMARRLMASPVLQRRLSTAFEVNVTEQHLDRLAILAGLHDFGKALKGFQDKLEGTPLTSRGHVSEALAVLANSAAVQSAIQLPLLAEWFDPVHHALYATICHHGQPVGDDQIRPHLPLIAELVARTRYGHDPIAEIAKLCDALIAVFARAKGPGERLRFAPSAQHLFAGILMAADWMASGFAFEPGDADHLASNVLDRTVWSSWHSGASALSLLAAHEPRPAQIGTLNMPLDERFAVIEAPTGSGKTEAALIWASRLVEAGLVDGMYFAVPTRSAASELHSRIARLMSAYHPALKGKIVRALPGMLDTDNSVPDYPAETWAVAAPKRVFAAPIAVGTIDQALLSAIKSRHSWMRAAFLSRHLLVVDEVHASDPYMASLTRGLIERHLSLGGRALAMSATLGETALAILMDRERRPMDAAISVPYPAIRRGRADDALPQAPGRIINVVIEAHAEAFARACVAAADGQSVLWLRSTVSDATRDFLEFEAQGANCLLHHSRYAVEDRTWLDQQLLGIFGIGGNRTGIIAVTTQTAEQSLDIDADLLITDACPADVLLQRIGRLHRHRSGTRPTAVIIDPGPVENYLAPGGEARGRSGQGWPWVYRNLLSVRATLDWLRARKQITVPDDCRILVERATHADYLREMAQSLGGHWTNLWRELFDDAAVKAQTAEANQINWALPYRKALITEWLPTRLGDGTVTVAVRNLVSPFTQERLTALPIPGRWLHSVTPPQEVIGAVDGQIQVGSKSFGYDRLGLVRTLNLTSSQNVPGRPVGRTIGRTELFSLSKVIIYSVT